LDARSVCGCWGGFGARQEIEEANARETDNEEAVARGKFSADACGESWARANIQEDTNVSERFENDN
jgi:hypothetical protein